MTVADRIKNRRLELALSQTELAKRAGYKDKTAISKFENAGNEISMKQLSRLATALNTDVKHLMGWDEDTESLGIKVDVLKGLLNSIGWNINADGEKIILEKQDLIIKASVQELEEITDYLCSVLNQKLLDMMQSKISNERPLQESFTTGLQEVS